MSTSQIQFPKGARQKKLAFLAGHLTKGGGGSDPWQLRNAFFCFLKIAGFTNIYMSIYKKKMHKIPCSANSYGERVQDLSDCPAKNASSFNVLPKIIRKGNFFVFVMLDHTIIFNIS